MSITEKQIPALVSLLFEKVNHLSVIVESNNKLLKNNGYFTANDLQKFFSVTHRTLNKLLKDGKIKEYELEGNKLYRIDEVFNCVKELRKEKEAGL
jgi:hypothetical protein